jgi:bifunctional ADP-heptose synthase (sugar kinase/adenylyltransferase)
MVTLSEHGAYVHEAGHGARVSAHQRKIVDVSGAGDTVIAVAALALAQGLGCREPSPRSATWPAGWCARKWAWSPSTASASAGSNANACNLPA